MTTQTIRKGLLGATTGFALGYAGLRALHALSDLGAPFPSIAGHDARRYGTMRRGLRIAGMVRGIAGLASTAFVLADPLEHALRAWPRLLRAPAFAVALVALETVRDIGVDYIEDHVAERVYGTSDQTGRDWFNDHAKTFALGAAVTVVIVALLDAAVTRAPRRWPLVAIAATPPLLAFATVIVPTFVMPLFNTYEAVGGDLERTIRALAGRYGVGNASILRFDMSRQTKKANAFVTGVLGTERIALADTLIESFAPDETLFVVAHELGHYVRRDPWLGIALGTAALAVTLLGADAALRATSRRGLTSPAQGTRLAFYGSLLQLGLMPVANAASRALERRADRFALEATGNGAAGIRAFRRLGEQNLAELDPPRWAELVFGSHPSLASRIRALDAAGAAG